MKTLMTAILLMLSLCQPAFASFNVNVKPNVEGFEKYGDTLMDASQATGVNFIELVAITSVESSFVSRSRSSFSRAAGLGQFIDSTWKATLRKHGKKYNLSTRTSKFNARANALMTAEHLKDNRAYLEKRLKRNVQFSEVYMAHLLGAGGASKLLRGNLNRYAANLLPKAVRGNRDAFYKPNGKPRTVKEMRSYLDSKLKAHMRAYSEQSVALLQNYELNIPTPYNGVLRA